MIKTDDLKDILKNLGYTEIEVKDEPGSEKKWISAKNKHGQGVGNLSDLKHFRTWADYRG